MKMAEKEAEKRAAEEALEEFEEEEEMRREAVDVDAEVVEADAIEDAAVYEE